MVGFCLPCISCGKFKRILYRQVAVRPMVLRLNASLGALSDSKVKGKTPLGTSGIVTSVALWTLLHKASGQCRILWTST